VLEVSRRTSGPENDEAPMAKRHSGGFLSTMAVLFGVLALSNAFRDRVCPHVPPRAI